jgi:NAD(P)-dependent dehydrogenase (short-subunit alcohol dehydrogenase family)
MSQDASVVVGAAEGIGLAVSERLARSHPGRLVLADVQGAEVAGVPTRIALVAGVHARHPALDMSEDLFFDLLRVNLVGVYLAAQTFAKRMIGAGVGGSIVAVTSVSARRPQPDMAAYVASKAAVTAALRVLGATVAPHGVRVNTVAPSATRTAMMMITMREIPVDGGSLLGM